MVPECPGPVSGQALRSVPSVMTELLRYSVFSLPALLIVFGGCSPKQTSMPEEAPTGLARAALDNPVFRWDSTATPTLTLYYQPGSYAADRVPVLRGRAEEARERTLAMLGETEFPHRLRLFYVSSREEMAALTGRESTGSADVDSYTVALVANESWTPFERHEVMHAVSLLLWGQPGDPATQQEWLRGGWLREGIATAAEDRCGSAPNRSVAAAMKAEGRLIPLESLTTTAFYQQDDIAAYLQAGSLVEYLIQTYGIAPFRRLWQEGAGVAAIYGKPTSDLEAEWQAWLGGTPAAVSAEELSALRERGCG